MVLCPQNLWHFESWNDIKIKYVIQQSITLFLMTAQLFYVFISFDEVQSYKTQIDNFETNCTSDQLSTQMGQLYIQYVLFFELFIPNYGYCFISLFCCQLCQIDKKLATNESVFIKSSFKIRYLLRIIMQLLIGVLLLLSLVQVIFIDRTLNSQKCNNPQEYTKIQNEFDQYIFTPTAINVSLFFVTIIFDNLFYSIIAFISSDCFWGSYHDLDREQECSIETATFSFRDQAKQSVNSQMTPKFDVQ